MLGRLRWMEVRMLTLWVTWGFTETYEHQLGVLQAEAGSFNREHLPGLREITGEGGAGVQG